MLPARHSAPLVLVLAALACGEETIPPAAKLLAVTPQRGSSLAPVAIAISGGGLNPRVITAFGKSSSRIDATFTARLSDVALEEVTLGKDHVLHAVVPAGLAPISHDLFVTDPWGREVKLSKAYRAEAGPTVASRLAFPTPPPPLRAGICSERLFVEREDPGGAPTAGPAEVPVSLVAAGLRLYSDLGCAAEISTVTIAANQTVASFHLLTNASGSFTLSATGQGLEPASATVTAQIDPAVDQIAISGPRLALTGKCSGPLLLVREDASGAEVARSSTANVRVDVRPPAGLQLFADRSCTVAATGAAITTGLTTARLWFSGVTASVVRH